MDGGRVLVAGATGRVGSAAVHHLLGHFGVEALTVEEWAVRVSRSGSFG